MRKSLALLTASAAAVLTVGLTASGAQSAAAGEVGTLDVSCQTGVSESDYLEGYAFCDNNTAGPIEFRVDLVCGVAPDVSGEWVRLEPGQGAQAVAGCAPISTGIGHVGVTHRPA